MFFNPQIRRAEVMVICLQPLVVRFPECLVKSRPQSCLCTEWILYLHCPHPYIRLAAEHES